MHGTHKGKNYGHPHGHRFPHGPGKINYMKGGCGPMFGPEFIRGMANKWQNFMPYDLDETDEEYIVTLALPGYEVKDIEVSVKGSTILIEANKEIKDKKDEKIRKVVSMGSFLWNRPHITVEIPVNDEIDSDNVHAKLAKGILKVRFKRIPGKKIEVEVEE